MSACRPTQGDEKVKLLSSCRFLTYDPIIYLQTNLMMYTCGCNVLTADSTSIQCSEECFLITSLGWVPNVYF